MLEGMWLQVQRSNSSDRNSGRSLGRGDGRPERQTLGEVPRDWNLVWLAGSSTEFGFWVVCLGCSRMGGVRLGFRWMFIQSGFSAWLPRIGCLSGRMEECFFSVSWVLPQQAFQRRA